MNKKNKLAIATVTWARTIEEKKIILLTIKKLSTLGYPMVVTDEAGSAYPLVGDLKKIRNISVYIAKSLDKKYLKSFRASAIIANAIFYIESDKLEFASKYAKNFISKYLKNPIGTMVPSRTSASFLKYPAFQQKMEIFIWEAAAGFFNQPVLDISYGPRIFPSSLAKHLPKIKGNIGWGVGTYLLALNFRLGLPLLQVRYSITPPKDIQRGQEVILLRTTQVIDCLNGLIQGAQVSL